MNVDHDLMVGDAEAFDEAIAVFKENIRQMLQTVYQIIAKAKAKDWTTTN